MQHTYDGDCACGRVHLAFGTPAARAAAQCTKVMGAGASSFATEGAGTLFRQRAAAVLLVVLLLAASSALMLGQLPVHFWRDACPEVAHKGHVWRRPWSKPVSQRIRS